MRKKYGKFYEHFKKFQSEKLLKHFSNSSKFFQIFPVSSKYYVFWYFKRQRKWEKIMKNFTKILKNFKPKVASTFF